MTFPNDKDNFAIVNISDGYNYAKAILTSECIKDFDKYVLQTTEHAKQVQNKLSYDISTILKYSCA